VYREFLLFNDAARSLRATTRWLGEDLFRNRHRQW
jgi:hypothetical protein